MMLCDFCNKEMDTDETGIMLMEHRLAGHMICAIRFQEEEKEDEKN